MSVAESINHQPDADAPNDAVEQQPTNDGEPIVGQRKKVGKPNHRVAQDANKAEEQLLCRRGVGWRPKQTEESKA